LSVLRLVADARAFGAASANISIGLVPTMGSLHSGHASLIERAVRENDVAVVSIFVNPTQFGPREDFAAYPRNEDADVALCDRLGVAMIFAPSLGEMYPEGDSTRVQPGPIADRLEGAARPGHFVGVATVVAKLFAIVRPNVAYFGQKDFQQLRVIQTMTRDLRLGIRILGCPIVREPDGLAMSSRNAYLSPEERRAAAALSRGLFAARDDWAQGERDPARLCERVRTMAAAPGLDLEYVAVSDPFTLDDVVGPASRAVISLAARVGRTRLIDNVLLGVSLEALA
jgi:pantoate--beta-alanine ligase